MYYAVYLVECNVLYCVQGEKIRLSLMLNDCRLSIVSFSSLFSLVTGSSWVVREVAQCYRDLFSLASVASFSWLNFKLSQSY